MLPLGRIVTGYCGHFDKKCQYINLPYKINVASLEVNISSYKYGWFTLSNLLEKTCSGRWELKRNPDSDPKALSWFSLNAS